MFTAASKIGILQGSLPLQHPATPIPGPLQTNMASVLFTIVAVTNYDKHNSLTFILLTVLGVISPKWVL